MNKDLIIKQAKDRNRRAITTALSTLASQGFILFASLVIIPMTVQYLGTERYGMWMTINSFTIISSFADIGMGNGLLSHISQAFSKGDCVIANKYVSNTFYVLVVISALLAVFFVLIFRAIFWVDVLNVHSYLAVKEVKPSVGAIMVCIILSLPMSIVKQIHLGYQEGYINSITGILGRVLSLVGIYIAVLREWGLVWFVLSLAGGPIIAIYVNSIYLFVFRYPNLHPQIPKISSSIIVELLQSGFWFLILQTISSIVFNSDSLIISQLLGASVVTEFSVAGNLFNVISMLIFVVQYPLWPAYNEAIAKEDLNWIKKTFTLSIKLSILFSVLCSLLTVIFSPLIYKILTGQLLKPSFYLLISLALWTVIKSIGNAISIILSGLNEIKFQVKTAFFLIGLTIPLKLYLTNFLGLPGVILATAFAYTFCVVVPSHLFLRNKYHWIFNPNPTF